jgi:hypothetical protein
MARVAWVLGYITAFNQYGSKPEGDVSVGKSTEQITAAIDDHCKQNPYIGHHALVDEFRRKIGRYRPGSAVAPQFEFLSAIASV